MKYCAIGFGLFMVLSLCRVQISAQDAETLKRAALYEPLIIAAGKRHGVDPRVLWTVAYLETRFRPDQVSRAGARGMMQFMPLTARRFGLQDPHEPASAIDAAARYLADLQAMFAHRLDLILAAYNSGEQTVVAFRDGRRLMLSNGKVINPNSIKTGGVPPYRETYTYVRNGAAVYSTLAKRREGQILNVAHLDAPAQISQEEPEETLPQEITQLKQGSIYVIESAVDTEKPPASTTQISTKSIYPR
jgi:membrane-bound lytic murein transglycosylase MltF